MIRALLLLALACAAPRPDAQCAQLRSDLDHLQAQVEALRMRERPAVLVVRAEFVSVSGGERLPSLGTGPRVGRRTAVATGDEP